MNANALEEAKEEELEFPVEKRVNTHARIPTKIATEIMYYHMVSPASSPPSNTSQ
jgi:hypothetical protein